MAKYQGEEGGACGEYDKYVAEDTFQSEHPKEIGHLVDRGVNWITLLIDLRELVYRSGLDSSGQR